MTITGLLVAVAALWWTFSVAALVASTIVALFVPMPRRQPGRHGRPKLTAIVPVKNLEPGFEAAQASLFSQCYAGLEITIATAEGESPAIAAARKIQAAYPAIASHIAISDVRIALSPKLNTMWNAIAVATTELVLIKDSNIRLDPGAVENFVRHLRPDVGVVSAISIMTEPDGLAAWTEAAIVNCFHGRILIAARAAGLGFGCGKIMLFRRSDLGRAGGLEILTWALGEDAALTAAMKNLGLRTVFADHISRQMLGRRTWREVWQRQLRWMLIWRIQAPAAFVACLLGSALPTAFAGGVAAPLLGARPLPVAAATLAAWCVAEMLVCRARDWPLSVWSPAAFLVREAMTLALWFKALTTDKVSWAGALCEAGRPPFHSKIPVSAEQACVGEYKR